MREKEVGQDRGHCKGGDVFHKALGVFHKALGSACVSLESKAFIAYHTSHKACMEDAGISGNIQTCTHTTIRHQY